jgi:hypothetical protein
MYHVTSSRNRASIQEHGLDVFLMSAALGIAGSPDPEAAGCFLCERSDVEWFADVINTTGRTVDVWEVDATGLELVEDPMGYRYFPGAIPASRLRLIEKDRQQQE